MFSDEHKRKGVDGEHMDLVAANELHAAKRVKACECPIHPAPEEPSIGEGMTIIQPTRYPTTADWLSLQDESLRQRFNVTGTTYEGLMDTSEDAENRVGEWGLIDFGVWKHRPCGEVTDVRGKLEHDCPEAKKALESKMDEAEDVKEPIVMDEGVVALPGSVNFNWSGVTEIDENDRGLQQMIFDRLPISQSDRRELLRELWEQHNENERRQRATQAERDGVEIGCEA